MTQTETKAIAHGAIAMTWFAGRDEDVARGPYAIADTSAFGAAFVDIVEARRSGAHRAFFPIIEHPRAFLLRAIYEELAGPVSYDIFLQRMAAFLNGGVAVSGKSQQETENGIFPPFVALGFQHAAISADLTIFRSHHERELADRLFGFRPQRHAVFAPSDTRVPQPLDAQAAEHIAIWAEGIDESATRLVARLAENLPVPVRIVRGTPEAADLLSSARLVVTASDDPGTAIALARFNRPLCCASPGAAEYLENVHTFDIWNASAGIDALLVGLASSGPRAKAARANSVPMLEGAAVQFNDSCPLVSIVVTVYDRLKHLEATLARLQRQTYPNIEIIVVSNNGPRADAICAAFPNVRYIHREHNSGVAGEPRNDGIGASRGAYVTALDDDDYFFDDHVESMMSACSNGAEVVYSNFLIQIVDPRPDGEYLLGYDIEVGNAITPFELMVTNRIGYMTVFAKKSVYDRLGGYDNINVYGAGEVELWLRMSSNYAMAKVERPTTLYTIRKNWKGSLTATDHFKFAEGYGRMYDLYPANDLPLIQERRLQYVAALRATTEAPARNPRYLAAERKIT